MSTSIPALSSDQQIEAISISTDIFRLLGLDAVWTPLLDQPSLAEKDRSAAIDVGTEMQNLLAKISERCSAFFHKNRGAIQNCSVQNTKIAERIDSLLLAKGRDVDTLEKNIRENAKKDIDILSSKVRELKESAHPSGDIHWACDIAVAATILCILSAAEPLAVGMGAVAYHYCPK